jgi:hypothetical protein
MTLQSSGAIKISEIKSELGSSLNSLRSLSALAGKSTPDSMSEFYGFNNTPASYTYSIIAYNGYTTVQGNYTSPSGGVSSFSFYNNSGSGGTVGTVCARDGAISISSGNGTYTKGGTCS